MRTTKELENAVREYQKGKSEYFDQIYEMSYGYLYTCVIHIVKNEETAMDMLQETYMEISRSILQLKEPEKFLSWAAMIGKRKCFAYLKKENYMLASELEGEDGEEFFDTVSDSEELIPESILQDQEKQRLVREIIDGLSSIQRLCIIGFYYNGEKQEEIAEELGIPVNTVKSHINRAKAKIKAEVIELDEKKGTRLYAMAPFLVLFFAQEAKACQIPEMPEELKQAVKEAGKSETKTGETTSMKQEGDNGEEKKNSGKKKLAAGVVASVMIAGLAVTVMVVSQNRDKDAVIIQEEIVEDSLEETNSADTTVTEVPETVTEPPVTVTEAVEEETSNEDSEENNKPKVFGKYDEIRGAAAGLMVVRQGEKWGAVTYDDQTVVPLEYEFACTTPNKEGQTFFGNQGEYKVFDKNGTEIFKTDRTIKSVSEGVVFIEEASQDTYEYNYQYVKLDGTVLYEPGYPGVYEQCGAVGFQEGYAVCYADDKENTLSVNGELFSVYDARYQKNHPPKEEDSNTSGGGSMTDSGGWCNTYPIGAIYQGYYVSKGLPFEDTATCYYIYNIQGTEEYEIDMKDLYQYAGYDETDTSVSWQINSINQEGNACYSYGTIMSISLIKGDERKTYLIDLAKQGSEENSWGDAETVFTEEAVLAQGEYIELSDEKYWLYSADGKWGYIDHQGTVVAAFDDASAFANGKAMMITEGQAHFIDEELNVSAEGIPADSVAAIGEIYQVITGEECQIVQ